MRTVDYSDVLNGSAALAGFLPADIDTSLFALFRTFHDRALQSAWEIHEWPELDRIEQRYFRLPWSSVTTYGTGAPGDSDNSANEVYDPLSNAYYLSLQAGNVNQAPTTAGVVNLAYWAVANSGYNVPAWATGTVYAVGDQVLSPLDNNAYQCITAHTAGGSFDATKFGYLTPFNRFISLDQTGETAIGEIFRATDLDPRVTTKLREYKFWLSDLGAQFTLGNPTPVYVWLQLRTRRPVLTTGDVLDVTLAYSSGKTVYYTASSGAGNFYTSTTTTSAGDTPDSAPSKWSIIQIPYRFRSFLIQAGYADWLANDGQLVQSAAQNGQAVKYLEMEADKLQRQQQQVRRLNFRS